MLRKVRHMFRLLRQTFTLWLDSHAFVYAGALAFFTVFSIAPVVIVAVAVVSVALGDEAASGQILAELQGTIGPQAAEFVQVAVQNAQLRPCLRYPTVQSLPPTPRLPGDHGRQTA
jgi:membrane protein